MSSVLPAVIPCPTDKHSETRFPQALSGTSLCHSECAWNRCTHHRQVCALLFLADFANSIWLMLSLFSWLPSLSAKSHARGELGSGGYLHWCMSVSGLEWPQALQVQVPRTRHSKAALNAPCAEDLRCHLSQAAQLLHQRFCGWAVAEVITCSECTSFTHQ